MKIKIFSHLIVCFIIMILFVPCFSSISIAKIDNITLNKLDDIHVYPGDSIQDAINEANPRDTIHVHSGKYYEKVTISKSITLLELKQLDRQIVQSSAKELEKDAFVALIGRNDILYLISTTDDLPANEIVKSFGSKTGAKGGGSKAFAQVSIKNIENPFSILKEIIKLLPYRINLLIRMLNPGMKSYWMMGF